MPTILPYFKFNAHDWLTSESILQMTGEQVGLYIMLLVHSWVTDECSLPADRNALQKLGRWTGTDTDMEGVLSMFPPVKSLKGRLRNPRLYLEWQQALGLTMKLKTSGQKGAATRWHQPATKPSVPSVNGVATWDTYHDAYQARYHVPPVRNQQVNSQLKQLVARLGADDAPQVAAFYLTHNKPLYVSARHPANLLLRDCEGLRTEWATGIKSTSSEARQAEVQDDAKAQVNRVRANMEARKHGST